MSQARQQLVAKLIQSHLQIKQLFLKSMSTVSTEHRGCLAVLSVLDKEGPLSQHAIAEALCHSDAAVSRQIKELLKKQYISSSTDPTNRRRSVIKLTAKGRTLLHKAQNDINAHVADLLSELSDAKLTTLLKANQELQAIIIKKQQVN